MEDKIARLGLLEDEAILLDASALELASLDHLGVALDSYVDLLGDITRRLVVLGSGAEAASERADALVRLSVVSSALRVTEKHTTILRTLTLSE